MSLNANQSIAETSGGMFQAVIEATEEAISNSMFMATTVVGRDGNKADALPTDRGVEVLRRCGVTKR
jgi:D-aminopeptidase